jgi:hypothetical protein
MCCNPARLIIDAARGRVEHRVEIRLRNAALVPGKALSVALSCVGRVAIAVIRVDRSVEQEGAVKRTLHGGTSQSDGLLSE